MTLPATSDSNVTPLPFKGPAASVTALKPPARRIDIAALLGQVGKTVIPPLVVLAIILAVWQVVFSQPGSSLPPPSEVWAQSYDLIVDPFFVYGSQDIGLGLRVLTSLQRVAIGFGLAAVMGVAIGALIGQSIWMMRGLDPIFQILRTVPPLAWLPISLAAFMDSGPSAIFVIFITAIWPVIINTAVGVRNIPRTIAMSRVCCSSTSSNSSSRSWCPPPRPTSSPASGSGWACPGSPSSPPRC